MEKKLLILGAGQYGCVAMEVAQAMNCFEEISFLDDQSEAAIGKLEMASVFKDMYSHAFVAIGNSSLRGAMLQDLAKLGYELAVLVHPKAVVMPSAELAGGSIVEAQAVINSNVKLAYGSIICAGAVVNHNSELGACCQVDCNAVIASNCIVPAGTKILCGDVFWG